MKKSRPRAVRTSAKTGSVNLAAASGCVTATLAWPSNGNRVSAAMATELMELFERVEDDADIAMLAITGAGDIFCAGFEADVNPNLVEALAVISKPTVAIINGDASDEGMELAMAADIRIARKDAGKIGLPEVNLGVLPGTGGTQRLSRMVGKSKAIELMVTGNTFSFEEAKDLGIVNDIFEREGFMENIMEYARQFTPPNKAAKAVGRIKRAVQTGWEIPMESALAVERENQQILFQSEDAKEGLAAYVEKRPAEFKAK